MHNQLWNAFHSIFAAKMNTTFALVLFSLPSVQSFMLWTRTIFISDKLAKCVTVYWLILCDQQRHPPNQVNGLPAHWKQLKVHKSPRTLKRNQKKFGRTVTMSLWHTQHQSLAKGKHVWEWYLLYVTPMHRIIVSCGSLAAHTLCKWRKGTTLWT